MIRQGDVFWLDVGPPIGSGPGFVRPHVVVQSDTFNESPIRTAVMCGMTTNLRRARAAGNILLAEGEANLPSPTVVNVTQVVTVDRSRLEQQIGRLSPRRLRQVLAGILMVLEPS